MATIYDSYTTPVPVSVIQNNIKEERAWGCREERWIDPADNKDGYIWPVKFIIQGIDEDEEIQVESNNNNVDNTSFLIDKSNLIPSAKLFKAKDELLLVPGISKGIKVKFKFKKAEKELDVIVKYNGYFIELLFTKKF